MISHDIPREAGICFVVNISIFLSTFCNKIDKKGRISVPSPFRSVLSQKGLQGLVLFQSIQAKAIEGMGMDRMEKISQSIDRLDLFSQAHNDWSSSVFANAHHLFFDKDGRVILPEDLKIYAEIKDAAAFVGQGPTFQIWNPEHLAEHQEQSRQRILKKQQTTIGAIFSTDKGES